MEITEKHNLITDIFMIYKEILILRGNVKSMLLSYGTDIYDNEYYNISGHYNFPTDKIITKITTILFILRGRVSEALTDNIIEEFKDNINKVKLNGMHK